MRKNLCISIYCLIFASEKETNNKLKPKTRKGREIMNTIATTILNQLGGHHFVVMTGAKRMVAIENGLRFNIGQNGSKANLVKVLLNGDDTYTMQFWKQGREINPYTLMMKYYEQGMSEAQIEAKVKEAAKKAEPKILKEYEGIYFDQLQSLFTEYTKLYTSLF